jgi:hypothetical protein
MLSEALAVQPDQRRRPTSRRGDGGGAIAQAEGEVLLAVGQPIETEHPGGRAVPVREAKGTGSWVLIVAMGSRRDTGLADQSVSNRGESA